MEASTSKRKAKRDAVSSPALKSGKLPGSYWPQIWKTWVIGLAIAAVVITAVVIYKKR